MAIEGGDDQVSASADHLIFAYYVTGHGFGHATRVTEVHSVSKTHTFSKTHANTLNKLIILFSHPLIREFVIL